MTVKIIRLMSVTPERKSASPIGLALKEKKTAMWQEYLEKTTNYNSFYLSPLCSMESALVFFFFEILGPLSYQSMLLHWKPVYPRVLVISRPI